MSNRRYNQFYYTAHNKPVQLDCNFIVDSSNGNGLGIRSLKGPGIANVFMHTSSTPAAGSPNPAAGYIYVQFQDNFNRYYFGNYGFASPLSGSSLNVDASDAALTVGKVYVITAVGTSTAADWVALGVPIGTVAAAGVSFVAAATGAGTGNGTVQLPKATGSGINHIEVVGDPNLMIKSSKAQVLGQSSGSYMLLQCLAATNSSTTTLIASAPADGTTIGLSFVFSNSSIMVQGE